MLILLTWRPESQIQKQRNFELIAFVLFNYFSELVQMRWKHKLETYHIFNNWNQPYKLWLFSEWGKIVKLSFYFKSFIMF